MGIIINTHRGRVAVGTTCPDEAHTVASQVLGIPEASIGGIVATVDDINEAAEFYGAVLLCGDDCMCDDCRQEMILANLPVDFLQ
jgi:hypothetical protein